MCTFMTIDTKDGAVITGRTSEFTANYHSTLVFRPRNWKFPSNFLQGENNPWTSKYSMIHSTAPGMIDNEYITGDGMNEKGISVALQTFHYHDYKELALDEIKPGNINIIFISLYILGNYATVQEVREAKAELEDIFYWVKGFPQKGLGQHIAIVDASGDSVVIEPENKEIRIKENPLRVLTNSSPLEYHYENLRKFSHLSPYEQKPKYLYKGLPNHKLLTQGNGLIGIPGDFTADSRFVRAAIFTSLLDLPETSEQGVTTLFRLLHTADVLPGIIRDDLGKEGLSKYREMFPDALLYSEDESTLTDRTDNILVRDLTNLKYYYKTWDNITPRVIDFGSLINDTETKLIKIDEDNVTKFTKVNLS